MRAYFYKRRRPGLYVIEASRLRESPSVCHGKEKANMIPPFAAAVMLGVSIFFLSVTSHAGTMFTYQGQLKFQEGVVNGSCNMRFRLYDQSAGGSLLGTVGPLAVTVTAGVFSTELDFGHVLGSGNRWVEISVDCGSGLIQLAPRQALTSTPYAYHADKVAASSIGNDEIQNNAISSEKITDGTIDSIDIKDGSISAVDVNTSSIQRRVTGSCAANSAIASIAVDGGVTCAAAAGDITAVAAGTGLTGGGSAGAVTLNVSFAGRGGATTAARSDHDHLAQTWQGDPFNLSPGPIVVPIPIPILKAVHQGSGDGFFGESATGVGVRGTSSSGSPARAGVLGSNAAENGIGVRGASTGNGGIGVFGVSNANSTSVGVQGESTSGIGVRGIRGSKSGFLGHSLAAVRGEDSGTNGTGVYGQGGSGSSAYGVHGVTGDGRGVYGVATGTGHAVHGQANTASAHAGYFVGKVHVNGTLSKSSGTFKIDHPLDPANKFLAHSFVESSDMKNLYDGIITLDAAGEATIVLPEWFEALNRNFRYQLTPIGNFAPLYVASEVAGNSFRIAGGRPGMRVSWQVTGSRNDAYALAHPIVVEEEKQEDERGRYLHPVEHGQPESLGIGADPEK